MKASTPSLIFYFSACIFTILFTLIGQEGLVLYAKSLVVPSIFIYYLITNKYKIDLIKGAVFLFSFIGDIFILMNFNSSEVVAVLSFLIVYLLLIIQFTPNFKNIRLKKSEILVVILVVAIIAYLSISILSLQLDKMKTDFSIIIIYSIILCSLITISVINYLSKDNHAFLNMVLMSICFMFSDLFYVLNGFYLSLSAFSLLEVTTQVFSYYFMVNYFIATDRSIKKIKQ